MHNAGQSSQARDASNADTAWPALTRSAYLGKRAKLRCRKSAGHVILAIIAIIRQICERQHAICALLCEWIKRVIFLRHTSP